MVWSLQKSECIYFRLCSVIFLYMIKIFWVSADILRLDECWKYDGRFTKLHREKALTGSVLLTFVAKEPDECVGRCLMMTECKSTNLRSSDLLCELNSKDSGDEGAILEKRSGWDVLETSDEEENVCFLSFWYISYI